MGYLILVLIVVAIIFAVVKAFLTSPTVKGAMGEAAVNLAMKFKLDESIYHLVKDVTLPTSDGTTQIDHVIVSSYGVFVIETKTYNGAIYGSEHQRQWTQTFGRNKFRFQNPLHQNYKHTRTMGDVLGIPDNVMKPVVLFIGDGKLMTRDELPANVLDGGLSTYVESHREQLLTEDEVQRILVDIERFRLEPGYQTRQEHIKHVKAIKVGKDSPVATMTPLEEKTSTTGSIPSCPKCGRGMVLRTATRGQKVGNQFWGCPGYPSCRGTRDAQKK